MSEDKTQTDEVASEVNVKLQNFNAINTSALIKDEVIEIFKSILTSRDDILTANILDKSDKIILPAKELVKLLTLIINETNSFPDEVRTKDIKIVYEDEEPKGCLKKILSPFKKIKSITVYNKNLRRDMNEIYNAVTRTFKISLSTIYYPLAIIE